MSLAGGTAGRWALPVLGTMLIATLFGATPVAGQNSAGSGASRLELQTTIDLAAAGSVKLKNSEYQEIQRRLTQGDFSTGDQISLTVSGEPTLTGTFPVEPGPSLILPDLPAISLHGVLRSELQQHLTIELSRYLRNPDVRATSLMRIAMFGSVGNPGFYHLSPNMTLSDAIMSAGGPTTSADMGKVEIKRGNDKILDKKATTVAITQGVTLDRLNLQGGDAINIGKQTSMGRHVLNGIIYFGAVATAILAIQRLTGRR